MVAQSSSGRRCCSPLWAYPRYFAAAIVPLSGFAALGALAIWDAVPARRGGAAPRLVVACALAAAALVPATHFDASVLANPLDAKYPGTDGAGYVTATSAQSPLAGIARAIEAGGGPYPVHIDVGLGYPWGLDLRLNGAAFGKARRYDVFSYGTPKQLAGARYVVTDGSEHRHPAARGLPPRAPRRAQRRRRGHAPLRARRDVTAAPRVRGLRKPLSLCD